MTHGSPRLLGSSGEAWFAVDPRGTIHEFNESAAELLGLTAARATRVKCHELLRGKTLDGTPVCRAECPYLEFDPGRAAPSPLDMLVPGVPGTVEARGLEVRMHHLAIRSGRQVLVLHLLENVRARRRNERIGARLEALRMGVPDAAGSLTKREFEVLRLVVEGLSSVQIAAQLGIRPVTARNYVARVLDRLGVSSRSSALMRYLVGPSPSGGPDAGASPAVHGPAGRTTVRGGGNGPRPRQDRPPRST